MSSPRPNRFILNTDYMTMAQVGNHSVNVVMPTGTTGDNYIAYISKDINLPSANGAIPRYLITYQTTVWNMDTQQLEQKTITVPTFGMVRFWTSSMGYPSHLIMISRKNANTVTIADMVETFNANENFPSITFKIDVSYIYPPNV